MAVTAERAEVARGEGRALVSQVWRAAVANWELIAIALITGGAVFLRLWQLDYLPPGFHGDEANVTLDAQQIGEEGWIGAWSLRSLGYPIAVNYVIAPFVKVMGPGVLSVRLPVALLGVASVPLFYVVTRKVAGPPSALFGTLLFVFSLWYLHLNRIGVPVTAWVTMELAALLCMMLGFETRKWWWFLGAGLLMGVGLWIYNSVSVFVFCCGVYTAGWALWELARKRDLSAVRDWMLAGIMLGGLLFAGWPLISYARSASTNYTQKFESIYIFNEDLREACELQPQQQLPGRCEIAMKTSFGERAEVVWERLGDLYRSLVLQGAPDYIDGLGAKPPLGKVTAYLALAGMVLSGWWFWRKPPVIIGFLLIPILAVATVLSFEGQYRRFLGAMPFIVMYAGIALGLAYEWARRAHVLAGVAAAVVAIGSIAYVGVHTVSFYYGGEFLEHEQTRFVYAPEARAAFEYIDTLEDPYVYFMDNRRSLLYETREVLAPDIAGGEDRSKEFTKEGDYFKVRIDLKPAEQVAMPPVREPKGAVFVFVNSYSNISQIGEVMARYPGGVLAEQYNEHFDLYDFRAYYLPGDLLESYMSAEGVSYALQAERDGTLR